MFFVLSFRSLSDCTHFCGAMPLLGVRWIGGYATLVCSVEVIYRYPAPPVIWRIPFQANRHDLCFRAPLSCTRLRHATFCNMCGTFFRQPSLLDLPPSVHLKVHGRHVDCRSDWKQEVVSSLFEVQQKSCSFLKGGPTAPFFVQEPPAYGIPLTSWLSVRHDMLRNCCHRGSSELMPTTCLAGCCTLRRSFGHPSPRSTVPWLKRTPPLCCEGFGRPLMWNGGPNLAFTQNSDFRRPPTPTARVAPRSTFRRIIVQTADSSGINSRSINMLCSSRVLFGRTRTSFIWIQVFFT